MKTKNPKTAFTLIELLVYIGLVGVGGAIIITSIINIAGINRYTRASQEVMHDARHTMDMIVREIQNASDVYWPTSAFESHPGQLSLVTTQALPADETNTYIDLYLDDDALYVKREGTSAQRITSPQVELTNISFIFLKASTSAPSIRTSITFQYKINVPEIQERTKVTFTSTALLRSR